MCWFLIITGVVIKEFYFSDPCFSKDCGPNAKCKLLSDGSMMCGKSFYST